MGVTQQNFSKKTELRLYAKAPEKVTKKDLIKKEKRKQKQAQLSFGGHGPRLPRHGAGPARTPLSVAAVSR